MPWDVPLAVAKGGLELYKQRSLIAQSSAKVRHLITNGVLRIGVFGAGGVGKNELGRFLSAADPASVRPVEYRASRQIDAVSLPNVWGGLLIAPGQAIAYPEDWGQMMGYLVNGKCRLVVNVVSWGYHSIALPKGYQDAEGYRPKMSVKAFLNAHRTTCQGLEERQLEQLKPNLIAAKRTVRMLTLISKQDIWWPDRDAVRAHYETGAYGQTVQDIRRAREQAGRQFLHEYLPASLVISNFRDGKGKVLAETAKGYDQNIQQAYQISLLDLIRDYAKR